MLAFTYFHALLYTHADTQISHTHARALTFTRTDLPQSIRRLSLGSAEAFEEGIDQRVDIDQV